MTIKGELCKATVQATGIQLKPDEDPKEFLKKFDVGMHSGLISQQNADGFAVSGTIWCMGDNHASKPGSKPTVKGSDMCLAKFLRNSGMEGKFTFQGSCILEDTKHDAEPPVAHEGYLIDYSNSTIRDPDGNDFVVNESAMKLFSILSHTPQTYEELYNAFSHLSEKARKIGRSAIWANVRYLEHVMGKDVIQRTPDKKIMLAGGLPHNSEAPTEG